MKNSARSIICCLLSASSVASFSQNVIFLHHSTGANLYNQGHVAQWFTDYNSAHGKSYTITERAYPDTPYPWDNYPYDYWNLWINNQCNNTNSTIACLDNFCANYDIIVFKHCFPGADILEDEATPSVSSPIKTMANYQLQYRALRDLMDSYPNNKFIVWTLAPLHRLETTASNAARARQFVDWVKNDWLQEDGKEHANIFIFDFYGYVAESNPSPANGQVDCLKYEYEKSHTDVNSHPNQLANETVGPVFAQFIVNVIEATQQIKVSEISVSGANGASAITTYGGTLQLSASVSPANATDTTITWSIQNGTGQASISSTGLVTGIANGTVTATATANDGSGVSGTFNVTISNQDLPSGLNDNLIDVAFISMSLSQINIQMKENSTFNRIILYNIYGSPVMYQNIAGKVASIDCSSFQPGVYIMMLSGKGDVWKMKVVVP